MDSRLGRQVGGRKRKWRDGGAAAVVRDPLHKERDAALLLGVLGRMRRRRRTRVRCAAADADACRCVVAACRRGA